MPSLYDLMQPSQPAMFDLYDMPDVGASPSPTLATQAGMGGAPPPNWMEMLAKMAKQFGGTQGASQMGSPTPPSAGMAPTPNRKGFISDARSGFNVDDAMKVAAIVGTMGMATPAVAGMMGAAGAGGAAGATGAAAPAAGAGGAAGGGGMLGGMMVGGGGGGGIMDMFGGLLGGGGGGGDKAPAMSYPALPQQRGPLVPQNVNQWGMRDDPWMFRG